jgi:steroid delta-isomerase-like uncharacterized protein
MRPNDERRISMSTEENKALEERSAAEVWNKGNLAVAEEVYATDVVVHGLPPELPSGVEGVKATVRAYRAAFPDFRLTVEDLIAEGDRVVGRWTLRGTHKGELFGIPATGKQVMITGINIDRIADGRIAESWSSADQLGLMQQLGVVPTPGG